MFYSKKFLSEVLLIFLVSKFQSIKKFNKNKKFKFWFIHFFDGFRLKIEDEKIANQQPDETTNQQPDETTNQQPDETTNQQPDETTNQQPDEATNQQPDETTNQQPENDRFDLKLIKKLLIYLIKEVHVQIKVMARKKTWRK